MRLIPRDEHFFEMFAELARRITASGRLLQELFAQPARLREIEAQIKAVEHEADGIILQVNKRLDASFVTPIDREDIHLLANRLDNVVDLMDGTARRAAMFRITESRPAALALAETLVRAGEVIEQQVANIRRASVVTTHGQRIKQLEEEGDAIYQRAVGDLFDAAGGHPNPLDVIKWKEIYDKLEEALDECEDVSNVLESIALKNS